MGTNHRGDEVMTRRTDLDHLPGVLGELARKGHGGAALILANRWGGQKRYIPARPREGLALVDLIGLDAAYVVAAYFHGSDPVANGGDHDIPKTVLTARLAAEIRAHPGTTREAARALNCTERYVRLVRQGEGPRQRKVDPRQISLLDL